MREDEKAGKFNQSAVLVSVSRLVSKKRWKASPAPTEPASDAPALDAEKVQEVAQTGRVAIGLGKTVICVYVAKTAGALDTLKDSLRAGILSTRNDQGQVDEHVHTSTWPCNCHMEFTV